MPGQDQTLCIEPCDGEARRELRRATRRNTETEKDLISTVIHLCIEPCGGEARRKLRRATRRNTETEEDGQILNWCVLNPPGGKTPHGDERGFNKHSNSPVH